MEDFHQMLLKRHSIRKYTGQSIDTDHVRLIIEAALIAPSSKSSRPWQFVAVDDREVLDRMAECKQVGAMPLKNAPLAIVVCADSSLSDVWVEDASVAASFMQLQAEELGLGSCWVQIRGRYGADGLPAEEYLQELLGIPETINVLCVVTFGHKNEERRPVDPEKLLWEKVHVGRWNPINE